MFYGCDTDAGTSGDGNGNGPDVQVSPDNDNPGVDQYVPPEDDYVPPEDGTTPPPDTGPSLAEELNWLKNEWVRKDAIPYGPYEVDLQIEERDGVYVVGLYPGEDGLPIEKIDENTYRIYLEDVTGDEIEAIIPKNCTEFELYHYGPSTELIFIYGRP